MTVRVAASLWSVPAGSQAAAALGLAAAGIDRFHWDLADGSMGPAGGFAAADARRLAPVGTASEAHLMCTDPRHLLDDWLTFCDTVAVHASQPHWLECVRRIASAGVWPVVAATSAEEVRAGVAAVRDGARAGAESEVGASAGLGDRLDVGVLVMAVVPGYACSAFDAGAFEAVRAARGLGVDLVGVDGSVTAERGRALVAAGATWLVSGTSLTASDPSAWRAAVRANSPPAGGGQRR